MKRYLAILALFCTSCDPKFARALLDAIGPFACAELQEVTNGSKAVGVACPAVKALVDSILTRASEKKSSAPASDSPVGKADVAACSQHLVVLDQRSQRVAFLCDGAAAALAADLGGKAVAP